MSAALCPAGPATLQIPRCPPAPCPEELLKRLCLAGLMVVVYQNLLTLVSLKLVYNRTTAKFNWFKKKKCLDLKLRFGFNWSGVLPGNLDF